MEYTNKTVIVDDDSNFLDSIASLIEDLGGAISKFSNFKSAYKYIQSHQCKLYIIDMKPLRMDDQGRVLGGGLPRGPTEKEKEVLELPEQICLLIKKREGLGRFYFITGEISKHDEEVIERTGAPYVLKTNLANKLEKILT